MLGSFLYSTSAVIPDYKTFPYRGARPYAAKMVSGGGIYMTLDAGEGFTYAVTFKHGSKTAKASGAAPHTYVTVKIPTGFGSGSATIVLKAEMNPARMRTVTLQLGRGKQGGSTVKPKLKPKRKKPGKRKH